MILSDLTILIITHICVFATGYMMPYLKDILHE